MTSPGLDESVDLEALGAELLSLAAEESARRAARTLPQPIDGLRQTVLALRAGTATAEHNSPGPAALLVLRGRVRLVAGDETVAVSAVGYLPIPPRRHSLHADEDSVVLLSVALPAAARPAEGA